MTPVPATPMTFAPRVDGSVAIQAPGVELLQGFRRRVAAGLLSGTPHPRSKYVVDAASGSHLHVQAADWWTALNVGLNEISLDVSAPGRVRYEIRYWRWAMYAIGVGAILVATLAVVYTVIDLPTYVEEHSAQMIPWLSTDQHVILAWAFALFWGGVWPWLLIALHKRPLRRLMERLIAEVDGQVVARRSEAPL